MRGIALLGGEGRNPDPFKTERVGHPEKPSPPLGVDVLQWYHRNAICHQHEKFAKDQPPAPLKTERVGHPKKRNPSFRGDVPQWYCCDVIYGQEDYLQRVGQPRLGTRSSTTSGRRA